MIILFTAIALGVHIIFIYRRDLLIRKKSFFTIFAISIFLFLISYVVVKIPFLNPRNIFLLRVPVLTLLIFQSMKTLFFGIFKSNPVDTFWTMDISLMEDGIFNFLFWVLGIVIPVYLASKVF